MSLTVGRTEVLRRRIDRSKSQDTERRRGYFELYMRRDLETASRQIAAEVERLQSTWFQPTRPDAPERLLLSFPSIFLTLGWIN